MEEGPTVPLICYWNGELSNEDRYAQYVGGCRKAGDVSKNIGFTQFKQKIQSMMKVSSDQTDFKIKCGVYYDGGNTLVAADVDDDDSLQYILGRSGTPLRAYIIKDETSFTRINTQREEALPAAAGDVHLGGNNFAMEAGDNNRGGWKENPIHHMDNLEERSCPFPVHETWHHHNEAENDFAVGQEFQDADTFREAFSDLAVRTKKEYRPVKTTKAKLVMRCIDTDCKWRISAIRVRDLPAFKVKKYQNLHTCSADQCAGSGDHRQATTKWIASKIKSDIKENRDMTLTEIITAVRNRFGVQISYNKAVKARAKALKMVPDPFEEAYHLLPGLVKELDRKGWVTQLSCNKDKQFVYLFWAFRASIHAFRTHLRPILYIYTMPIRSGVLMSAYSFDGDNNGFFIAFGVFEEENDKWWEKFLNLLKEFICSEVLPLVIVTKFDPKTTVVLVPKVFPKVNHCFICRDFVKVFVAKFNDYNLESDMRSAAKSYDTEECDRYLERIEEKNKDAYEWLLTVGKSCWSVAYSGFDNIWYISVNYRHLWRYDIYKLLITELIVWTRDKVAADFLHRQMSGAKMRTRLTTGGEYNLHTAIRDAGEAILVVGATGDTYQAFDKLESREFVVNLVNGTCSCGRFQVKGIPCKHAVGVIILMKGDLDIYSFCQPWVTADAYRGTYAGYTFEEAYHLIPGSIKELEGSGSCVTKLNCREDGSFVYCFWAFPACIHAFRTHLHPELFIETRALRGRVLMSAHCVDGNEDVLFIAFGIFEEENEKWWEIFLNELKEVIVGEGELGRPWIIVTQFDPETSEIVVPKVFPQVNHRFYSDVFYNAFTEKFKGWDLECWMEEAAESYESEECDGYLERIKEKNEDGYDWLVVKVGKSRWTNSYSWAKTGFLCPVKTRTFSNSWDKFDVFFSDCMDALSIRELMVRTTEMVARDFLRRQRQGAQMTDKLTAWCERNLRFNIEDAQRYIKDDNISNGGTKDEYQVCNDYYEDEYQVCNDYEDEYEDSDIYRVSLVNYTCSCGDFQRRGYPCMHAAAVITRDKDLNIYDYCKPWTTAEAYRAMYAASNFHSVPRIHYPSGSQVLPPKRKVGRPNISSAPFSLVFTFSR